eukprot:4651564-Pleurochrysis_carterae.AAC.4
MRNWRMLQGARGVVVVRVIIFARLVHARVTALAIHGLACFTVSQLASIPMSSRTDGLVFPRSSFRLGAYELTPCSDAWQMAEAGRSAGIKRFWYASSACIYPESKQVSTAIVRAIAKTSYTWFWL